MRILTLDFLNVNSLAGHWHIDFTDPAYRTCPLFAITGKTGAGKSSVLDAVCLALYGQTPRVKNAGDRSAKNRDERQSKDDYDDKCPMMTKGTREIQASVRFEAGGRLFASTWRRYVKRTGKLSQAQVEFIEFASEGDREGRIITTKNTEWARLVIDVTKMTFETFTRSVLLAQGAFSNFLKASDDDRAQILENITGTAIYTEIGSCVYRRWDKEVKQLDLLRSLLETTAPLASDERSQLEQQLGDTERTTRQAESELNALRAALLWRRQSDEAEKTYNLKDEEARKADELYNRFKPRLALAEKARQAKEPIRLHKDLQSLLSERETLSLSLQETVNQLQNIDRNDVRRKTSAQQAAQALEEAVRELALFEKPFRAMIELDTEIAALRQTHCHQSNLFRQNTGTLQEALRRLELALKTEQECRSVLESDLLRRDRDSADDMIRLHLGPLQSAAESMRQKERECTEYLDRLRKDRQDLLLLESELRNAIDRESKLTQLTRQAQSTALDARRALETATRAQSPEQALQAVVQLTERMASAKAFIQFKEDRDLFAAGLADTSERLTESNREVSLFLHQTMARFNQRLADLKASEPGIETVAAVGLQEYLDHLHNERRAIIDRNAALGTLQKKLDTADQHARELEHALHQQQADVLSLKARQERIDTSVAHLQNRLQSAENDYRQAHRDYNNSLKKFPFCSASDSPDTIVAFLQERDRQRQSFLQTLETHHENLLQAEKQSAVLTSELRHAEDLLKKSESDLNQTAQSLKALTDERQEHFGSTDPAVEKKRLTDCLETQRRLDAEAREAVRGAQVEKNSLRIREEETRQRLSHLEGKVTALRLALQHRMTALGFASLDDLLNSELSDDTVRSIERTAEQLRTDVATLQGQRTQAWNMLQTLKARPLTEDNVETLSRRVTASEQYFLEQTRLTATLRASLEQDDKKRRENAKQLRAIEAQQTVCGRWDRLRQLIGSADGKTFRTAAQKITFRILLNYANDAMNTMTKRYWLYASDNGGLSIDVIDNDMGGQRRTSKNLSGGESFLVSLALALGLSRMGGSNLRVDTLFLDEGFGTLDESTLNQALYALENLQASSGKLIGIISHVNSIKERIATHIHVSQRAGSGISTLSGPGVARLPT